MIDLEELIEEGLLSQKECDKKDWGDNSKKGKSKVCFDKVSAAKQELLHQAFLRARKKTEYWKQVELFFQEQYDWLSDYALYLSLKEKMGQKPWMEWEEKIRFRDAKTLDNWKETLKQEMEYPVFVQYLFYSQWMKFKEYCNRCV